MATYHVKKQKQYESSSYFAGNNVCFWLENDEIHDHKHSTGIIRFCELCWWKEIENGTTTLYFSTKKCNCLYKLHCSIEIRICEMMNTIKWNCAYCSLKLKSGQIKHMYLYPNRYKEDFEIFFECPQKRVIKCYPKNYTDLKCIKCLQREENCENIGYTWFCKCCHMNQFILNEDNQRMTINPYKEEIENSCVFWQCIKCSKLQINFFNDEKQENHTFECLHCN